MKIEIDVTPEKIADLMTSAIEGGYSRYWCGGVYYHTKDAKPPPGLWYADGAFYDGPNFQIEVIELDGDDETSHIITREQLVRGLDLMAQTNIGHLADWLQDEDDAETADVFLQCVALGEVRYG